MDENNLSGGVPMGGWPTSNYHPRCDCHSCTQIRGQERNPFYLPAPTPWVCWCGRNYPHNCTWCLTGSQTNTTGELSGLPCETCGATGFHQCSPGWNKQGM
jgi:hypothetical protein